MPAAGHQNSQQSHVGSGGRPAVGLYTAAQKRRRDESVWTLVQGILAPLQFLVFLVSLVLVVRYLTTGSGFEIAAWSVLVKTAALLAIMVTGSLWEHDVFGRYLFVPAFFWEDVVSFGVIALHLAYVCMFTFGWGSPVEQMVVALLAYGAYVINAGQFVWKFRLARTLPDLDIDPLSSMGGSSIGGSSLRGTSIQGDALIVEGAR